jgi:hypothetical protein
MGMWRGLLPGSAPRSWTALSIVSLTTMVLIASGCSGDGGSADPETQKLCDGAVGSAAETALEKMTGSSALSSETDSGMAPEKLRERALKWGTEGDPESSFMSWRCSISPDGDQDEEIGISVSVTWSAREVSDISEEVKKGSQEYLEVSSDVFIGKNTYGHPEIYFPCQVAKNGKKSAMYTLWTSVIAGPSESKGTQSDANKFALSVARWMSGEVGCVNDPEIPASA